MSDSKELEAKKLLENMGYKVIKESESLGEKLDDVFDSLSDKGFTDDAINRYLDNIDDVVPNWENLSVEEIVDSIIGDEDEVNESTSINESLDEDLDDELKQAITELAEETGNDIDDVDVNENGPYGSISVTFGDKEYALYSNHDDAIAGAVEDCKYLLDDCGIAGINFNYIGGIENFVETDWFEDALKESDEFYIEDIKESEPERFEEEFPDMDEDEALEKMKKNWENDPIQYYIDAFGKKDFEKIVKDNNLVDFNKLAEAIVDCDGPANTISSYDGKEIELPSGYYAYRIN